MSAELRRTIRTEIDASRTVLESTLYCQQAGFDETPSRRRGIEIEAVDRGPGIANCEAAMRDHFSSGGTLGLGLPGVKRMMDEFSLESTPGEGTRVTARKWI
jgi:anti-sigma regulatory factor (Ser/Thr protein kinase)